MPLVTAINFPRFSDNPPLGKIKEAFLSSSTNSIDSWLKIAA